MMEGLYGNQVASVLENMKTNIYSCCDVSDNWNKLVMQNLHFAKNLQNVIVGQFLSYKIRIRTPLSLNFNAVTHSFVSTDIFLM